MLFNSPAFIFGFAPMALLGFFLVARLSQQAALAWLTVASLFFYGWWNPAWVPLLLASITFNFLAGIELARRVALCANGNRTASARTLLILAVAVDLGLLVYYKYAAFFADNLGTLLGVRWRLPESELPLGISFFTFTQIAFLVDVYQRKAADFSAVRYGAVRDLLPAPHRRADPASQGDDAAVRAASDLPR